MHNTTFSSNIRILRSTLGIVYRGSEYSQKEFAKMLDVSRGTYQNWELGLFAPSPTNLSKLSHLLKLNFDLNFSPEGLLSQAIKPFDSCEPQVVDTQKTHKMIPLLATIHAGEPCHSFENVIRYDALPITKENRLIEFGVLVEGCSMEPTFHTGDALYLTRKFDPSTLPNKSIIIVCIDDELVVRRYIKDNNGGFILHADNPDYPPIIPNGIKDFRIVARVLSWFHNHAAQFEE